MAESEKPLPGLPVIPEDLALADFFWTCDSYACRNVRYFGNAEQDPSAFLEQTGAPEEDNE